VATRRGTMTTTAPATSAPTRARGPVDDLGLGARRRRAGLWALALLALLVVSALASVGAGAVAIPPGDTARIAVHHLLGLGGRAWPAPRDAVVWDVRRPRVVLAVGVARACRCAGWRCRRWCAMSSPTPTCSA